MLRIAQTASLIAQVKAGISAVHLGDDATAERHFSVLRALGAANNADLYLAVADALVEVDRLEDALPYLLVIAVSDAVALEVLIDVFPLDL